MTVTKPQSMVPDGVRKKFHPLYDALRHSLPGRILIALLVSVAISAILFSVALAIIGINIISDEHLLTPFEEPACPGEGDVPNEGSFGGAWGCPKKRGMNVFTYKTKENKISLRCCSMSGKTCASKSPSGKCFGSSLTLDQAKQECAASGMRVCTKHELLGNVCCGSGCGYDNNHVWFFDPHQSALAINEPQLAAGGGSCPNPQMHTDFEGYDLEAVDEATMDICCAACSAEPRCAVFTYSRLRSKCWLKAKMALSHKQYQVDRTSAKVERPKIAQIKLVMQWGLRPCVCPEHCWELLRAWLIGSVAIAIAESFILLYVIVHDAINLNHNRRHNAMRKRDNPAMHRAIWFNWVLTQVLRIHYMEHGAFMDEHEARLERRREKSRRGLMFAGIFVVAQLIFGLAVLVNPLCGACSKTMAFGAMRLFLVLMAVVVPLIMAALTAFAGKHGGHHGGISIFGEEAADDDGIDEDDEDYVVGELTHADAEEWSNAHRQGGTLGEKVPPLMPPPIRKKFGVEDGRAEAIGAGMVARTDSWSLHHAPRPGQNYAMAPVRPNVGMGPPPLHRPVPTAPGRLSPMDPAHVVHHVAPAAAPVIPSWRK